MSGADRSVATIANVEEWHPSYWTLACVGTFHLILAATLLTAIPTPTPPRPINVVDVVTFPDGVSTPVKPELDTSPVELKQTRPDVDVPLPKEEVETQLGPKPTDRRQPQIPEEKIPPSPALAKPQVAPALPPSPEPKPIEPKTLSPAPRPVSAPGPTAPPVQAAKPVPVIPAPPSASLIQPDAAPLSLKSAKLKLKQVTAIKQISPLELKEPPGEALPMAAPVKSANSLTPVTPAPVRPLPAAQARAPTAPAVAEIKAAPLALPKARALLPKVQVPRIAAVDLRLPEVKAATPSPPIGSATNAKPAGVTSVASSTPSIPRIQGGAGGSALPNTAGGGGSRASGGIGPTGGSLPANNVSGSTSGSSGGPSGVLPRRPGGASVRQEFPRGDDSTVLGRMDKTYDCSRLNRERDARCPNWDPIEGRNQQGAGSIEVAAPKGLPKLRNPIGTNPLPTCPPGTPGNQMGLSCLPTREGPGIPRQ